MAIGALTASRNAWLRAAARGTIGLWTLFWTYFLVANLLDNQQTVPASEQAKGYRFIFAGLILVWSALLLVWRKEHIVRIVLPALGVLLVVLFLAMPAPNLPTQSRLITAGLIGGLPILAGLLLIFVGKQ